LISAVPRRVVPTSMPVWQRTLHLRFAANPMSAGGNLGAADHAGRQRSRFADYGHAQRLTEPRVVQPNCAHMREGRCD